MEVPQKAAAPAPARNSGPPGMKSLIQKVVQYIGRREIQEQIRADLLDPLLDHVMKRVFPYIILTCVLFILLLLAVLLTLGIILFQLRAPVPPNFTRPL